MKIEFSIPEWLSERIACTGNGSSADFSSVNSRMELAISLAGQNIAEKTGGPFGAVIFNMETWKPLSAGVNLVTACNCSILHAEIVAITTAQITTGCFDLSMAGSGKYELVTSAEPCAMCFGAIPWSGITSLVCGARDSDVRNIGFDEGPKLHDWREALEARGISVIQDIERKKAAAILESYSISGGIIYNGRRR